MPEDAADAVTEIRAPASASPPRCNCVDVVVLEKHGDFLRDFRGDTIHPSTLESFTNSGCSTTSSAPAPGGAAGRRVGGGVSPLADFTRLPTSASSSR